MSRGLKGLIVILIIAILTVAGIIVISKIDIEQQGAPIIQNTNNITQGADIEIKATDKSAISPVNTTFATSYPPNEHTETITATPSPTDTQQPTYDITPTTTAFLIPPIPESVSDEPQILTGSNMNGYIYVSYASEKKVKVMMDCNGKSEVYDLIGDGKFHRFTLHLGEGEYLIRLVENTTGQSYRIVDTEEFSCELIDETFPYLFPNSFVVYDNYMEVIQFGLELTEGLNTNEEKARAIYDWIVRNIEYDFTVLGKLDVGYLPNPQRTYETRTGICSDFSVLFASMCRSQGIPCKVALGYYVKTEYYHAWNEVYLNGEYYIVDTSGDSQTGTYDFTRTDGYTKTKEH